MSRLTKPVTIMALAAWALSLVAQAYSLKPYTWPTDEVMYYVNPAPTPASQAPTPSERSSRGRQGGRTSLAPTSASRMPGRPTQHPLATTVRTR